MKKTKISLYFVSISFLTLLTIFILIVQKSYFSFITPQKLIENDALLNDFSPNLDLTVISIIESKNKNIDELFDFSIIKSNQNLNKTTPTPTITITPQIIENQTPEDVILETETIPTPTTPQIIENSTPREAATGVAPSVKSSATSTSIQ